MKEKAEKPAKEVKKAASKKSTKAPDGVKVSKEFEFTLNASEKAAIADKGAALHMNIENTELNFKELKTEWGARLKTLKAQHAETQHAITNGKEKRVVDAIMVKDYDSREITYFADVDGIWEKMETRTMTKEEAQMELEEATGKSRAKKQKIAKDSTANLSGMTAKTSDEEIGDVIKEETNKKTKRSAVDGAVVN